MDEYSISARTEVLREEIRIIQQQEHIYRREQRPSLADEMAHANRKARLLEIKAQLEKLRKIRSLE